MMLVLSAIVIIAVVVYFSFFYFQRRYAHEIALQKEEINKFTGSTVQEQLQDAEKSKLAGETLSHFEETKQDYRYMVNHDMPEILERLDELSVSNERYRFFEVGRELKLIEAKIIAAQKLELQTKKELTALKRSNSEHQKKIKELEKKYQNLRKTLLAKNFSYGPSIDQLEDRLASIEKTFDTYTKTALGGDYIKSSKILNELTKETVQLEKMLKAIPPIYRNLKNVFPVQLKEITAGSQQMQGQGYRFKDDPAKKITELKNLVAESIIGLTKLETVEAANYDQKIDQGINQLYDELEAELKARAHVEKGQQTFSQFVKHARSNQHELLLELDRLNQNYTFNHNELAEAQELEQQLKTIEEDLATFKKDVTKEAVVYSEVLAKRDKQTEQLRQIEKKQTQIGNSVQDLWQEEQAARNAVKEFDLEIHRLKRDLEKLHLPGLSKEYLDYFYTVSDEIEALSVSLEKTKINMEEITKALLDVQADLDALSEKTNDIVDSSALTERVLQYANRYRVRYPEVAQAANEAYALFNQKFDYAASLEKIATAVDKVEPGAYKKIEDGYYHTQNGKEQE
ncbi:septation ring formation regulator EzrA [Liquorilactobacillus satsumensis]|uniref:septation ring formation regulator EzrA n=1 Tax=Liquorilactobacillus satsumensis TaxID=259059 RepID=UPI0021C493EB|nr:septation ring formation regulator EzrA [Liquorilactobacillus satsumensis]MCP9312353.1 septation ring formation regulator EzrA [Liquorilactobacillus satsumensis]MCP9327672.1 septation ring formation regulator EzrA [Liquorilactobacillus satsumensis]MCP9359643.1 septation ring formation regulator EzrA [Liquorilactobacillus satsumensis]